LKLTCKAPLREKGSLSAIRRRLDLAWKRLFRHSQWNIGILPFPAGSLVRPGAYSDAAIEWFPLDNRKRFLADPFGLMRDGKVHVLCEDFVYRSGKGSICSITYSDHRFTNEPESAIDLPVHMSYPFLVEADGEIYCIPETSRADEVALYQAVEFPRKWRKAAVLLEHFGGVDPTVFRHDGERREQPALDMARVRAAGAVDAACSQPGQDRCVFRPARRRAVRSRRRTVPAGAGLFQDLRRAHRDPAGDRSHPHGVC